jgi:hypothetical protein
MAFKGTGVCCENCSKKRAADRLARKKNLQDAAEKDSSV